MIAKFYKSKAHGTIHAQPSKSYAHRLLIASFLAEGTSIIKNVVMSNDILATINIIRCANRDVDVRINEKICRINSPLNKNKSNVIKVKCLESASTLRFFIPILLTKFNEVEFTCNKRLVERGIKEYIDVFKDQDIHFEIGENTIKITGKLKHGYFKLDCGRSSQYLTGLLFALPLLEEDSIVEVNHLVSESYIDITLDVLNKAGIIVRKEDNKYIIPGSQTYQKLNEVVEGDYSNAAFIEALNYIGGKVRIKGLNKKSLQGDRIYNEYFDKLSTVNPVIDLENCIDLGPILCSFASLFHGATLINVSRLRLKESDRIQAVKEELAKFNVQLIEDGYDKIIIKNDNICKPKEILSSHNDHRIIMALSLMLIKYGGEIEGIEEINKSYPDFFYDLQRLNVKIDFES